MRTLMLWCVLAVMTGCASQSAGPWGAEQSAGPASQSAGPWGAQQSAGPYGPSQSAGPGGAQQSAGPYGPSQSVGPGGVKQCAGPMGPCQTVGPGGAYQGMGPGPSRKPAPKGQGCQMSCSGGNVSVQCPVDKTPVCRCDPQPSAVCQAR